MEPEKTNDMDQYSPAELLSILQFHADSGVDVCLENEPIDRFVEHAPASSQASPTKPALNHIPKNRPPTPNIAQAAAQNRPTNEMPQAQIAANADALPDEKNVVSAQEIAKAAQNLDELRQTMETFEGCPLKRSAGKMVFADGNPEAKIMLIGEAPGREEDRTGTPFVGRAGQLLDRMLASIELDRSQVYITNVIPWRPPGNRTPTPIETQICEPFVRRHMELIDPDVVVMLGGSSAKTLLGVTTGIMQLRGKWQNLTIGSKDVPAMPTLHPAYLLRQPTHKKFSWADLLAIKLKLQHG